MGGSLFSSLQTALSALEAQQTVLGVTAHNVANANTPGYARQQVVLESVPAPVGIGLGTTPAVGGGVRVATVQRLTSSFLTQELWSSQAQIGAAQQQTQTLGQVQALLNEPSSTGLSTMLDAFWNSWQNLANDPQSMAARQQVLSAGDAVATGLSGLVGQTTQLQAGLNTQVSSDVRQINSLAGQVASLNGQIAVAAGTGQTASDLEDARDALVGKLSQLVPLRVSQNQDGEFNLTIGTVQLVAGTQTTKLLTKPSGAQGMLALSWSGGMPVSLDGGQLGATLDLRDTVLPSYLGQLNQLAQGVASAVNTQHAAGYDLSGKVTGLPFFVAKGGGTLDASTLEVNPTLVVAPNKLAAAGGPFQGPGDGANALAIGDLNGSAVVAGATSADFYAALVGQLGSETQAAQSSLTNLQNLQQGIQQQISQISGVSLDAEMTRMVQAQNAYAAAAKVSASVETMLSALLSMVQ